jgi:asparagine synthase (glutamine-hydrolysing)
MCGILGSVNIPFDKSDLDVIAHRGPDGEGITRLAIGAHNLTLGHRRLAIVDLSPSGAQPMETPCGRFSITFNGEIYNHQDLRKELPGISFRGHSDTETLLHHVARHGITAARACNGIFAFALVDREAGRLFLVRDPFGVKPLYYLHLGATLVFASEIKPILRLAADSLDPAGLAEVLRLRYLPAPDTLFRNVRKVRPGHIVEFDLGGAALRLREFPYFNAASSRKPAPYEQAEADYGRLLEAAVGRQLMSDVEVGMLLSGGIDSALVAAFAQKRAAVPMKAFTIGFHADDPADETADAAETARELGLDHHVARIDFPDFLEAMRTCVSVVEEPLATTSIVPMYFLAKLAGAHVKVVLSGQGADEPLGGYGRYQAELYRRAVPAPLARIGYRLANRLDMRNEQLLRGLRSLAIPDELERFLATYTVFDEEEILHLTGIPEQRAADRLSYFLEFLGSDDKTSGVERMMAVDLRMNLADDLLLYTDKITMRHSLECRVPMLDLELIDFVVSLPASYRVKRGAGKIIHKRFAEAHLPRSIVYRKKKGFQSPTRDWFARKGQLREILLDPRSQFATVFDLAAVEAVLDQHARGYNRERQIFLLLGLHYWMDEYLAPTAATVPLAPVG